MVASVANRKQTAAAAASKAARRGAHLGARVVVAVCEVQVCGPAVVVRVDELMRHRQLHLPVVLQAVVAEDHLWGRFGGRGACRGGRQVRGGRCPCVYHARCVQGGSSRSKVSSVEQCVVLLLKSHCCLCRRTHPVISREAAAHLLITRCDVEEASAHTAATLWGLVWGERGRGCHLRVRGNGTLLRGVQTWAAWW